MAPLLLLLACSQASDPGVPDRTLPADAPVDTGTTPIAPVVVPAVWINEVMPENDSTWQTVDGRLPAWAEIVNASDQIVDRADLTLNDAPIVWVDAGDTLAPGALALVELTEDDAKHALTLAWHGEATDSLDAGDPGPDRAWARFDALFDGEASGFALTGQPTPGYVNGNSPPAGSPDDLFFDDYARFDITLPQASWDSLAIDPYTAMPATLGYERVLLPVTAHLKGVYGSLRTLDGKASFSLDLNAARPGGTLRGQKKIKLNNMVQDPSGVHEWLTYGLFRAAGLWAPRVGYAQVYVNGEYWGVYTNVEAEDDVFLDRNFGEHGGNLYEGAYGVDFYDGYEEYFECDECPFPDDRSDITAVTTVLNGVATDAALAELDTLVDMDSFLTVMAVEAVALHWDGYTTANNYRIFNDPGQGRFELIPWGTDQTWIDEYYDPWSGYGRLLTFCIENPTCEAQYEARLLEIADLAESLDLPSRLVELLRLYNDDFIADPRVEWDLPTHETYVGATLARLQDGPQRVRDEVAAH